MSFENLPEPGLSRDQQGTLGFVGSLARRAAKHDTGGARVIVASEYEQVVMPAFR